VALNEHIIPVVAALIRDASGRVLLVRKRGTSAFMQPGGKRAAGESDVAALAREIDEELGCRVAAESARALGVFDAPAANEPGFRVRAAVYAVDVEGAIVPRAEIDHVPERHRYRPEQAEQHVDLHVRVRDTGGACVAERGSDGAVAPDVRIHSRSRTRRPISRQPTARSPGRARSAVRCPAATTAATARSIASAAAGDASEYRQSIAADRMAASGFARSCPAMSGAEPWIGS